MLERTFAMIKPNAVEKRIAGKILSMWEDAGFEVVAIRKATMSRQVAEGFYQEHSLKPFFKALVDFMTSGPTYLLVLEKENAVADNRKLMGKTNPADADPGTIRKLFGESVTRNAVHGSDATTTAEREIRYFFPEVERSVTP